MTIEEAERIVSQPGWKPTASPAQPERSRPPLKQESERICREALIFARILYRGKYRGPLTVHEGN